MEDTTLFDQPGIELDAEMAQRIIDHGSAYSRQTADLAQFIRTYSTVFRDYLVERGFLQCAHSDAQGFDLSAVDGASVPVSRGGGTLVAAAAYKSSLNDEKQRGATAVVLLPNNVELEAFATLFRMHLELSLLAPDKLDADRLVILDHSFWGVMQAVSRALAAYKLQRGRLLEGKQNPDTDAMQLAWKALFNDCLGVEGSFLRMMRNKRVISLSKKGVSQYFVNMLLDNVAKNDQKGRITGSGLNDRALLRHVLEPGEYITPQELYRVEREESQIKSWKRSRFATKFESYEADPFEAREQVFDEYGLPGDDGQELPGRRLCLTYYLPQQWSRVYRIEFHELMLANQNAPPNMKGHGKRFQRVLAAVRQSVNRETKEPLCQVLADNRSKAAVTSAISMLPERTFYQLRDYYRNSPEMLEIIDTLLAEERT
jgi:hypothetical protein